MFTSHVFLIIFFRFFNFCLLLFLGAYAYRKYGASLLAELIEEKDQARHNLLQENVRLNEEQVLLEKKLHEESVLCSQLKVKMDLWQHGVQVEKERYEKEVSDWRAIVRHKAEQRALVQESVRVQAAVTHLVTDELERSLAQHFIDAAVGEEYVGQMIKRMNERA